MSAPAAARPVAAEGYTRIRAGAPVAVRGTAALIWVEGPDAAGFLQGLRQQRRRGARRRATRARRSSSTRRGTCRSRCASTATADDAFTIVVAAATRADLLVGLLERYHFSEDLELLGPEPVEIVTLAGGARAPGALDRARGRCPGTRRRGRRRPRRP